MNSQSLSRIHTKNVLNAKLQRKFNIYNKTPPTLVGQSYPPDLVLRRESIDKSPSLAPSLDILHKVLSKNPL